MSIPGLGQLVPAAVPTTSTTSHSEAATTIISLQPFWEYRFEVPVTSALTIRLLAGTAEKDGTELAQNNAYIFSGTKSKINTWNGCELEVSNAATIGGPSGSYNAYVAELSADETPLVSYLNLHMKLEGLRSLASRDKSSASGTMGPRVLVVGPAQSGKTSLVRSLAAWATRMGRQPLVVNADPARGMLSLPGTLSAAVFATIMDVTTEWGGTPSSGPAGIPVKLPLVYYYGLGSAEDSPKLFTNVLGKLAAASTSRLAEDPDVRSSGLIIDTEAINPSKPNYDTLSHIVAEFSINIVISLGSERVAAQLTKHLSGQRTSLGEDIAVVGLDKSGGVVEADANFMQQVREKAIKEYFFGDAKRTLSPGTQNVSYETLTVWKVVEAPDFKADEEDYYDPGSTDQPLEKAEPSVMMMNCTLAVVYASVHDSAEAVRDANVMGFVYITDVDEKKRRIKVLAPLNARLGDRPLIWGNWPEPMVSLLG